MLITCPSCASEYDIDPSRIGPAARKVRCAACRESWIVGGPVTRSPSEVAEPAAAVTIEPNEDEGRPPDMAPPLQASVAPAGPPVVTPIIEPEADRVRRRPDAAAKAKRKKPVGRSSGPRTGRVARRLAAGAAAAMLVIATPAAILGRAPIVAALPGTASLFAALGMPVNLVGLSFAEVTSTLGRGAGGPVLEVAGRIVNAGHGSRRIPPLILVVEDEAGQPLYTWPAKAEEPEVGPAAQVSFTAKLASPPGQARSVKVSFGEPAPARPAQAVAAEPPHTAAHEVASR